MCYLNSSWYEEKLRCTCALGQGEGVAALRVQGNFMFDAATHRDFLGAILGTGIERSKVGDIILVGETGAQILVAAELLEHFEQSLTQASASYPRPHVRKGLDVPCELQ